LDKKKLPEISIVIIVGIILIILAAGISYFIAVNIAGPSNGNGNGEVGEENGESVPEMGEIHELGEFIRNISNGDGRRMLRVEMVLEVSDDDVSSQIQSRETRIRDQILDIIRDQTVDDLQSSEGVEDFKADVIETVNENVDEGEVMNVYFKEFIIT